MQEVLLDSDMLSEIWKRKNATVVGHAARYLAFHSQFTFSTMSKYEVLRGLKQKKAKVQEAQFTSFRRHCRVVDLNERIADRAAEPWADAMNAGKPADDADLLIAATALENNLPLCTGNTSHFDWIPGLKLVDWRLP
jgi:tRNA(fMet)-specific endonuclease VapC